MEQSDQQADRQLSGCFRRFVEEHQLPRSGQAVLVGLSGGLDSMCLAHFLRGCEQEYGYRALACTVDHGVRPFGRELRTLESWCRRQGLPWKLAALKPGIVERAGEAGQSFEARARAERYEVLEAVRVELGADLLATAHHQRDQAETVLLRLLRGAGPRGLEGIRSVLNGVIIRPFLELPHPALVEYARRHSLPFCPDPTNQRAEFLRNRVRNEVLPLLEDISPGATAVLARSPAAFRGDNLLLEALVRASGLAEFSSNRVELALDHGAPIDRSLLPALLHAALSDGGLANGLELRHFNLIAGLEEGDSLDLPRGLRAERRRSRIAVFLGNSRSWPKKKGSGEAALTSGDAQD